MNAHIYLIYVELGCKFLHSISENCQFGKHCTRSLCPARHGNVENNENETDDEDKSEKSLNESKVLESFVTSTPKKRKFQCEDCRKESQCVDCFVEQFHDKKQVHFSDI